MMTAPGLSTALTKSGDTAVYLEGRRVGTIISEGAGFAYVPSGQPREGHGEVFPSVNQVLKSLEAS